MERVFINKNSKTGGLLLLVTFKYKFILYSGRLEAQFAKEMDNENELITSGAFNRDSSLMLIGTSQGKIYTYKVSDGEQEGQPHQAAGVDMAITQLVTIQNIEDNEAYLMTAANKELFVYIHNKKDAREVDFGEDGQLYLGHDICNVQMALNSKFFMIGIPAKRAIGFFGINRVQLNTKPLKWVVKVSLLLAS